MWSDRPGGGRGEFDGTKNSKKSKKENEQNNNTHQRPSGPGEHQGVGVAVAAVDRPHNLSAHLSVLASLDSGCEHVRCRREHHGRTEPVTPGRVHLLRHPLAAEGGALALDPDPWRAPA